MIDVIVNDNLGMGKLLLILLLLMVKFKEFEILCFFLIEFFVDFFCSL